MNKYYIAIDFDGTLVEHDFPNIGMKKQDVINKLYEKYICFKKIYIDVVIILWTCREGIYLEQAKEWCENNLPKEIIPTYYNENPEYCNIGIFGQRKIVADEYWDDRNVLI